MKFHTTIQETNLHISRKLSVIGLAVAALIVGIGASQEKQAELEARQIMNLAIQPSVVVLDAPRNLEAPQVMVYGPDASPSFTFRATGYNSLEAQTDSTPNITATGERTRFGIIAVSRDLLDAELPYGSLVRIKDLGHYQNGRNAGQFQQMLDEQDVFIVEDTMHAHKRQQVDVWFPGYDTAINWGVREIEVELVRHSRDGYEVRTPTRSNFSGTASFGR